MIRELNADDDASSTDALPLNPWQSGRRLTVQRTWAMPVTDLPRLGFRVVNRAICQVVGLADGRS
jgi:hypothetical protein